MVGRGRHERCSCGSGRKIKRCCGTPAGSSPADRARAELAALTRSLGPQLCRCTDEALGDLLDRVAELPALDISLAWALPRIAPPELEALAAAIDADDFEAVKGALPAAVTTLDSQVGRARLARAVLVLRDAGRIGADLAAAAVVDLASGSPQLVTASVAEAVLAEVGREATPSGLVVARS